MSRRTFDHERLALMFKLARTQAGWSMDRAAERVGVSKATISRAERMTEEHPVSLKTAAILLDAYDLNIRDAVFHVDTPLKHAEKTALFSEART